MRTCSLCEETKPETDFYKDARGRDGLTARCKRCHGRKSYESAKKNPDRSRLATEKWRSKNPDKVAGQRRRYYEKHKVELRRKARTYRQNNPDTFYAAVRRWKLENIERVREINTESKKRNPHTNKAYKQRRRANIKSAPGAKYTTQGHMQARWDFYGGRCYYCGEDAGSFDHRIPLARGGSHWPSNLVPCCMPCNTSKNKRTESEFRLAS